MFKKQLGFNLIELMIGISIGSLVILTASTGLVNSSITSRTTTDISDIQQSGSYALRTIGFQAKQSASRSAISLNGVVYLNPNFAGFNGTGQAVSGTNGMATDTLNLSYEGETDSADCNGNVSTLPGGRVDNSFYVAGTQLLCAGSDATIPPQVIADNVENFQVIYGVKNSDTTLTYTPTPTDFNLVDSIEVCIQIRSTTNNMPGVGTYQDCNGNTVAQDLNLHKVFRSTFFLRNRGFV